MARAWPDRGGRIVGFGLPISFGVDVKYKHARCKSDPLYREIIRSQESLVI